MYTKYARPVRLIILCALLLSAPLAGCRQQKDAAPEVQLAWRILPDPPRMGPAMFAFTLTNHTTNEPVAGADVRVEGNMSHPGMQPVLATATEVRPGHYEATLNFTMSGDWFILVDATLPDGRILHRQVDVPGVQAMP